MERLIPKQLDLEVTSHCNLKCKYCPSLSMLAHTGDMDYDLFTSIIDRIDFPCTVVPWLNGEPLLHPKYFEMIEYITDRNIPCYITTNGTIWNSRLFNLLTHETSCYQIIFSLDGIWDKKSRSIEQARPGSNREEIRDNIQAFMDLKRMKGASINIALKICRRGQDYEEIENYIAYWLKKGIDYVCVGSALVDDKIDNMRIYPCQYSDNNFMVIKSDGRVVLCAYNDKMTNDPYYAVGTLDKDESLLDIYNNEYYTNFRENQRKGIFNAPCSTCGFAYTGMGFEGEIRFRNTELLDQLIYYHQDYYNQFFSLTKEWKKKNYYKRGYVRK